MIQLEFERTIERPIEEVFARLVDIDAYEEWLPPSYIFKGGGVVKPDQEIGLGTRFTDETPMGTFHGEVTEFEPPRRVAFEQNLGRNDELVFSSRPAYTLADGPYGTRVKHEAEGQLFGYFRLAEPIVWVMARNERRRIMDHLKRSFATR